MSAPSALSARNAGSDMFSRAQRLCHWCVAGLYLVQLPTGSATAAVFAQLGGFVPVVVRAHVLSGILILALTLVRLGLRSVQGVPALPATVPRWQAAVSRASHRLLYALLVLLPVTGAATLAGADGAGAVHVALVKASLGLVALHVAAALVHHLVLRDGVLDAMLGRPNRV